MTIIGGIFLYLVGIGVTANVLEADGDDMGEIEGPMCIFWPVALAIFIGHGMGQGARRLMTRRPQLPPARVVK
jgi:hypothetical protein